MNMDDEALERAIFELPLEEPPDGLRASILLMTAYRPAPAFSFLELAAVGSLGAVALWMAVLLVLGGGSLFVHTLATIGSSLVAGVLEHVVLGLAWRRRRDGAVAHAFHRIPTRGDGRSQVHKEIQPIRYRHGEARPPGAPFL